MQALPMWMLMTCSTRSFSNPFKESNFSTICYFRLRIEKLKNEVIQSYSNALNRGTG